MKKLKKITFLQSLALLGGFIILYKYFFSLIALALLAYILTKGK